MEPNLIPPQYLPPPFTPTIEFKDETVLNARGGYNDIDDDLWIWTDDPLDFVDAVNIFANTEKTDKIVIHHSEIEEQTMEHYTRLMEVREGVNGTKTIRLKKR